MKSFFRILVIPYFLLWIFNVKVPIGPYALYLSFLYIYIASLVIIAILILHNLALKRSSALSVVLLIFLLIPTICYQLSGLSDSVSFDHRSGFPVTEILKLTIILLAFISFNELLARNYISVDFILKIFVISMLISIPKYLFQNYELITNLDVYANRPQTPWIGGWNTYAFMLSCVFVIIYKYLSLPSIFRNSLLILIFGVMTTTLSRGGVLALLVALFLEWRVNSSVKLYDPIRKPIIIITIFIVVLSMTLPNYKNAIFDRFVVSFIRSEYKWIDYLHNVTSARTILWLDTMQKIVNAQHFYQWLFGYGIGHYAYETRRGFETGMGNQYLLFVYEYGLIGGLGLSWLMFRAYSRLRWRCNLRWAQTIKLIFAICLVTCFVGDIIYCTQIGWFIGCSAAIVVHTLRSDRIWLRRLRGFERGTASSAVFAMKTK